jgi:hypothetical protein
VVGVGATYDSALGRQPSSGTYNTLFGGSWPSCSDASGDLSTITCFTNSNSTLDIVAPGALITASGRGGGLSTYRGTSQASPTAAGVAASMIQAAPALTPSAILSILKSSGSSITDAKNGLSFPRVNAYNAVLSAQCFGKVNGTTCNDDNACTLTDTCQDNTCVGGSPVNCVATDACHDAGTCNTTTGLCSNPVKANGSACNDGNGCTQADTCQSGICVGGTPVVCTAVDQCRFAGTCNPATGTCSTPQVPNGQSCNDGNACTQTDSCQNGICTGANPTTCVASDQCHAAGTCNPATGFCSNPTLTNGTSCNDGNACTQNDSCQNGVCSGASPVVCTALDQCHDSGTCDPTTGTCSNPISADGRACNDGNACTQLDFCQSGICTGSDSVVCTALDQCHSAGSCDAMTGVCSNPLKPNGSTCNDGNACTQLDSCQSGACIGTTPVSCTAIDDCHEAGACDPSTGVCSTPQKSDGVDCNDGNACTLKDTCLSGVCTGDELVVCEAKDQCHEAGTCDPATGFCSDPNRENGTSCDDADLCSSDDACLDGRCVAAPVVCAPPDQCHVVGLCNPADGSCVYSPKLDGAACDDGDACTVSDSCQAGVCIGAGPVACVAADQCHEAGVCDPQSGACSSPPKADGSSCDDENLCTQNDSCQEGTCTGSSGVKCAVPDQCHEPGQCDPSSGECVFAAKADGVACDDGDACTRTDQCIGGACVGSDTVTCPQGEACHTTPACDSDTGECRSEVSADGVACDDGNACTTGDSCESGVCKGRSPISCPAPDECHEAVTCDGVTGICPIVVKPDGTACQGGKCQSGTCVSSSTVKPDGGCKCTSTAATLPELLIACLALLRRRKRSGAASSR